MSIIPENRLRRRLASAPVAVGTMLAEIRQPSVMQALANAGFDWVLIDNEHGTFTTESIAELSRIARLVEVTPIVRVPVLTYEQIAQALDAGAQGIMLPRITSAEEVRAAVAIAKYPPEGRRGSAMGRAHTNFRAADVVETMAAANRDTFVIVQIETREAVEGLDEILSVPGVDAALIGPNDLAIALGVPGRMRDPVLEQAIERTIEACRAHGALPAIHTNDVALSADWARRGMRLVSISTEMGFLQAAGKAAADAVRGA